MVTDRSSGVELETTAGERRPSALLDFLGVGERVRLEPIRGPTLLDGPVSGDRLELPAAVSPPPNPRCRRQVETEGTPPVARSPWMQFATLPAAVRRCLKELRPAPDTPLSRRVLRARGMEAEGAADGARKPWARLAGLRRDLAGVLQSGSTQ